VKLDRNITKPRRGKYALIKLRGLDLPFKELKEPESELCSFVPTRAIDYGGSADTDFFVIRLKDKYAAPALAAYAAGAMRDDAEYALEVLNLAKMAAEHARQRMPD